MVAEKKRGGNSSPAFFKKLTAACSGVALAVVTCLSVYDPIPVHADLGNFLGAVDYVAALDGAEADAFLSAPGGPVVAGIILGTKIALEHPIVTGGDVVASNFSVCTGKYYDSDRHIKIGCMCSYGQDFGEVGETQILIAYSDDYEIYYSPLPTSGASITGLGTSLYAAGSQILYTAQCSYSTNGGLTLGNGLIGSSVLPGSYSVTNNNMQTAYFQFNCAGGIPYLGSNTIQDIASGSYYGRNRGSFIGAGSVTTLPGDADTYIDSSYPDYVFNYIRTNYPDFVYIFPDPDPPQYATEDIIPGIPKEWTIINPELPTSPHLDLTIPDGDFQDIDPGETFTGFSSGVGFWWAMVNEFLNTFHIKTLALALLAVAVAIFALYKIGG